MECRITSFNGIEPEDMSIFSPNSMPMEGGRNRSVPLERNNSAPSSLKPIRQVSGDIVAIKRGNGEVAFAAVGRKKSQDHIATMRPGGFHEVPHNYQGSRGPALMGIDNLAYTTVKRGDTYKYDHTGVVCTNLDSDFGGVDIPYRIEPMEDFSVSEIPESSTGHHDTMGQRDVHVPETHDLVDFSESNATTSVLERNQQQDTDLSDTGNNPSENQDESQVADNSTIQSKLPQLCKSCGQRHGVTENHEFNYVDEVDEDLTCDICLQPLVDPYDTKCGHTFCCVCIKNYLRVKHMCPIDREEIENTASDCWQSSLVLRRLVDKLKITCPNEKFCQKTLQRCHLKHHLLEQCPGAVIKCSKSIYGCCYKGPRKLMDQHLDKCEFKNLSDDISELHPFSENVSVDLFRPEGTAELGIVIVGGSDTPLHYIIIQDIVTDSIAADGRLHIGDTIVEINGESMYSATHSEARAALTRPSNVMHLEVLRELDDTSQEGQAGDTSKMSRSNSVKSSLEETVCLIKPSMEQLGIRISTSESGAKGVYIIELIEGQLAQADGRLQVGDRIMAIGTTDLSDSTPEKAARVIGSCTEEVKIIVRHPVSPPGVYFNQWAQEKEKALPRTLPNFSAPVKSSCIKKVISVKKSPKENLGIIVSGGFNSPHGNLPIFVQDVLALSLLGKDNRIKRGDLLLQINSIKLVGLTHAQAMNILRESAQQSEVNIVAYELQYEGMAEDAALWDELTSLHQHPSKWAPSWKMWLSVTSEFVLVRDVMLRKTSSASYGIKFIGGYTPESGAQPVFISQVCQRSAASKHLKSGDEIIAINKKYVNGVSYMDILLMLKTMNSVCLKVVSWPGSLH